MIVLIQPTRTCDNLLKFSLSGRYRKCVVLHKEPTAFGYVALDAPLNPRIVKQLTIFVHSCDTLTM